MTVTITTLGLIALLVGFTLIATIAVLSVVRPWELEGLSLAERSRLTGALTSYDFWLSVQGSRPARRRELREELRTNLYESARAGSGVAAARKRVGSLRQLARQVEVERARPRWRRAGLFASVAAVLTFTVQLLLTTVWVDAASASGSDRVEGGISLVPGMRVNWSGGDAESVSLGMESGPAPFVVALVVLVLIGRPWRLGRRPERALAAR